MRQLLEAALQKMIIDLYTDGGARGNPGPSGIGAVIINDKGEQIDEFKEFIGEATNNIAEYRALISGLKLASKYVPCTVNVFLDSELICNQMKGSYKVKSLHLINLFTEAKKLLCSFKKVNFCHIPREKNTKADKLANQAMDMAAKLR